MAALRIGIGRFWHESNSFSSALTAIHDFASYDGIVVGTNVLKHLDRRDEMAGFADALGRQSNNTILPLLSAGALPSGLLTEETVHSLEEVLRTQVRRARPLDGICLALHGAMSSTSIADLDGHFLEVLREEAGPDVPVVCALDCHAVVTQKMVDFSTALIAYRTHPHTDLVETGRRAADILVDVLRGKVRPITRYQKIPMLMPPSDDGTHAGALKKLFDRFIAWDRLDGVIACSLCPGFAWQDVPEQGWTAIAVTDNDGALADRLARELAEACWEARQDLLPEPMVPPEEAIRMAAAIPGCPVIVTDSADTIGGGAPGDNTALLDALLKMRRQVDGMVLLHIPDPEAVSRVKGLKVADTVTVEVGGKRDRRFCRPLSVTGQLLCIADGPITNDGKFTAQPRIKTGAVVCLGIDNVRLVLTERSVCGPQPSLFRKVGIEPFGAKIVALKTGVGYKVTYSHAAKAVIRADCPGAESYNLDNYAFERIPRPMFPIDRDFDWSPGR